MRCTDAVTLTSRLSCIARHSEKGMRGRGMASTESSAASSADADVRENVHMPSHVRYSLAPFARMSSCRNQIGTRDLLERLGSRAARTAGREGVLEVL